MLEAQFEAMEARLEELQEASAQPELLADVPRWQKALKEIAQRQDISGKYMEQIISVLTRSGLLRSVRGAQGGYHLAKSPEQITVGMILRATEGDLAPAECVSVDGHACTRSGVCPSHAVFSKVYSAINSVIDGVTLCDLIPEGESVSAGHTGACL